MSPMNSFKEVFQEGLQRARATISALGIADHGLTQHLAAQMSDELGTSWMSPRITAV